MESYKLDFGDEIIYFDLPEGCQVDMDMIDGEYKNTYTGLSYYLEDCGAVNIRYGFVSVYETFTLTRTTRD